jgi:hypothetical protein
MPRSWRSITSSTSPFEGRKGEGRERWRKEGEGGEKETWREGQWKEGKGEMRER